VVDPAYGSSSSNQMDIFKNGRAVREGQATMEEFGVKAIDENKELDFPMLVLVSGHRLL
jgi:hypothetical protein